MDQATTELEAAEHAFYVARGWAQGVRPQRLDRRVRRLEHRRDRGRLDSEGMATLKGLRYAQRERT